MKRIVIFVVSIIAFSQVPGFIYKYEAVLEGEYSALERNYSFYIGEAERFGETLDEYFINLSAEGSRAFSVAKFEFSEVERFTYLQSAKNELDKDYWLSSMKIVFFETDEQIMKVALDNFRFEVPLTMSNEWLTLIIFSSLLITFFLSTFLGLIRLVFQRKNHPKSAT